ncbi:Mov34/MPN/PAD-1 family protein [Corallococcus carmarthensis]|uniref:Mov34/MPN/PAD-1 family protein n=1 Tax=Corallococcus carmarthensis TaxID=2316728 RepID=UPI00148DA7B2|nr:M67 family metallopeptidase [Corallococcus carmarthensis]
MLALRGGGSEALIHEPPPETLARMIRHLEAAWPHEGCGVILRSGAGEGNSWRVVPLPNVSPTPRVAYAFAPEAWLQVCLEADARQESVACVFHSHVEAPAVFSSEDRRQAAPSGIALLPQVSYVVVAIHGGRAASASRTVWSAGDFQTVPLPLADFRFEKPV